MTVNTETGIDRDADRFVIKLASTGAIINYNAQWPRVDGGAFAGMNADHKYYKRVANDPPQIDHRYELQSEDVFTDLSPVPVEGLPVGTFGTVYTPVKLPLNTLLAQIQTAFTNEVAKQLPDIGDQAILRQAAKALAKRQADAVLSSEEEALLVNVVVAGDKVDLLAARRDQYMAAAENDQDYDLTVWPVLS